MDTNNLQPEEQILLCVARRNLDAETALRLRNLATPSLDWEYLQEIAFDHALLPLLALHVTSQCADLVPPEILERLRTALFKNRESSLYLASELMRVLSHFKSAGTDAVAFKGQVLAQIAYEDIGLRQAGDLDILIHQKDFHRANDVLLELAYKMDPQLTPAQQKSQMRFDCEIQFTHKDAFSVVDLHWGLTPKIFPVLLTADEFLANRKTIDLAGQSIETFADEDSVVFLSVHAAKHYFHGLELMTALAELIRSNPDLSWAKVSARAREANAEKIVCLALMLIESLYALPVPNAFADLAGSTDLKKTVEMILAEMLTTVDKPTRLQMFRWNLRFLSKRDAYLGLARAAFVPTIGDWQTFSIPDALYPIYYLLRPVRLLTKYGGRGKD